MWRIGAASRPSSSDDTHTLTTLTSFLFFLFYTRRILLQRHMDSTTPSFFFLFFFYHLFLYLWFSKAWTGAYKRLCRGANGDMDPGNESVGVQRPRDKGARVIWG